MHLYGLDFSISFCQILHQMGKGETTVLCEKAHNPLQAVKMVYKYVNNWVLSTLVAVFCLSMSMVHAAERGPVTNLSLPRFVSMKAKEGNVRRGPSLTHRIDWVFKHNNMPLLITAEFGHWRRVQDMEGQGGWMHYALLSGVRTVVVKTPNLALRLKPNIAAATAVFAEERAIATLEECTIDWCEIASDGYSGWAPKADLWGVWDYEIRE